MFGFRKKTPEIDAAGAMFNLVRRQWQDVEEAKNVAATLLLLGDTELFTVAPEFKKNPIRQRVIAIAMFVSISKSGTKHFGRDGVLKLMQAAKDYAGTYDEGSFFADMRKALHLD